MEKCKYCGEEFCKLGIRSHVWRVHTLEGKEFNKKLLGHGSWNKGLTKETDERVKKSGETLKRRYSNGELVAIPTLMTKKSKKAASIRAKERRLGGHTSKKSIYYKMKSGKVVFLQSSYEVKVAEILDKYNIKWGRPEPLDWTDNFGESHLYYPDFYLPGYNLYLDPKNDFLIKEHSEKISLVKEQNDINLIVLDSKHLFWNNIEEILCHYSLTGKVPDL